MSVKQIFKKTALCFAVSGMMTSYSALAAPALLSTTQLNINGTVVASACNIDTNSKTVNVDLGKGTTIEASTLADRGNYTDWAEFELKLTNCPATTTAIIATFSGTPAAESVDLYKNDGDAEFVQIDLQTRPTAGSVGKPLGNGATHEELVNHTTNDATFLLQARAFTTQGGVIPGSITGGVSVGFTYR